MPTPIRAIVARFSLDFSRKAVECAIQKHPFVFCAHIGAGNFRPFEGLPAKDQDWFLSSAIRNANYTGVDWNEISPLDEKLIEQMRECESVFMSAVSRLEAKKEIPYLTRKLWYLRHLQFWNDYLTRHRINLFLSAWIPHEIPDVIIYHLCKLKGIPVLYFDITALRDVSFAGHDIRQATPRIAQRYHDLLSAQPDGDPETIALGEPFSSYERELLTAAGKPPALVSVDFPSYWNQLKSLLWNRPIALFTHAPHFLTPGGWVRTWEALQRWRTVRRAERFYAAHAVTPDLSQPFVYLPLHFQPEASTVPMGGVYADQILMARLLNAALPDGVFLYVKEHPRRSGWLTRSPQYYQEFAELKNVRLVPSEVDTFLLRRHCAAVATVTGSAGFESLIWGKPVFLFGSCYYQYARGVFPIRTMQDCVEAVRAVFERHEAPTHWSTRLYLKAMEDAGVPGVPDPWYLKITNLSEQAHMKAMGEAITNELTDLQDEIAHVH